MTRRTLLFKKENKICRKENGPCGHVTWRTPTFREEQNILVVPGDCFDFDHHLRISSALPKEYVHEGLSRMNDVIKKILSR